MRKKDVLVYFEAPKTHFYQSDTFKNFLQKLLGISSLKIDYQDKKIKTPEKLQLLIIFCWLCSITNNFLS